LSWVMMQDGPRDLLTGCKFGLGGDHNSIEGQWPL